MAGRCVSVSHLALGTVRVESTLATLGQAAGTAAAICAADSITPRDIYKTRMREFRQLLLRDDLTIPGLMNLDPDDLARTSKVSASSVSTTERFDTKRGAAGDFEEISVDTAALWESAESRIRAGISEKRESCRDDDKGFAAQAEEPERLRGNGDRRHRDSRARVRI